MIDIYCIRFYIYIYIVHLDIYPSPPRWLVRVEATGACDFCNQCGQIRCESLLGWCLHSYFQLMFLISSYMWQFQNLLCFIQPIVSPMALQVVTCILGQLVCRSTLWSTRREVVPHRTFNSWSYPFLYALDMTHTQQRFADSNLCHCSPSKFLPQRIGVFG